MEVFGERETRDHILTMMSSARLAVYKHVFTQHGLCQRPSNMGQNSLRACLSLETEAFDPLSLSRYGLASIARAAMMLMWPSVNTSSTPLNTMH
ncbi:hypothetical protein EYF80_025587 [Liparis tanakae]|uniref:Uncharacterized protein n=1 Tax=Liparis tanakae TaxID=230148 RepID=A0A4Z2HEF8_9TELE|nr:hypothetical protein EYF80_025587 [Liparis tanakae]